MSPQRSAWRLTVLLAGVLALGLFLESCSGLPAPVQGSDASLILGQVTLDVKGTGSTNGLDGVTNATINSYAIVTLVSVSDGKPHELKTTFPDGAFTLANAAPGQYQLVKLTQRISTSNAFVDITSNFTTSPTLDVPAGRVVDAGIIHWTFAYDLQKIVSSSSFMFEANNPSVMRSFTRANPKSPWLRYETLATAFSGDAVATSSATPFMRPRINTY
jgi:hypothetical protein